MIIGLNPKYQPFWHADIILLGACQNRRYSAYTDSRSNTSLFNLALAFPHRRRGGWSQREYEWLRNVGRAKRLLGASCTVLLSPMCCYYGTHPWYNDLFQWAKIVATRLKKLFFTVTEVAIDNLFWQNGSNSTFQSNPLIVGRIACSHLPVFFTSIPPQVIPVLWQPWILVYINLCRRNTHTAPLPLFSH